MKLADTKEDMTVYIFRQESGNISSVRTKRRFLAHIVIVSKVPAEVLLGWKDSETPYGGAWPTSDAGPIIRHLEEKGVKHAYWLPAHYECELVSSSAMVTALAGCTCRKCGNFAHMAVPNRPNGTFICWSCRQSWLPEGW